ncbi:MAG: RNA polymerase sigma-70 factor [Bacteroidales bacterium]|nr:RNA polymerase sigma-70 factor [Bacteroidales bacterium]
MKIIFNKENKTFSQKEFKLLFDNHFEQLRDYIYFKCSNIEQAEDVAQEAFLKLWEKRKEIKKDTVLSYLFRIAHNIFINQTRHSKLSFNFQYQNQGSEIDNSSPEYELELKEFDKILQQSLAALPEKVRVTFLMNRIDGLKYKEIAERLNVSVKTIEKRMQKAVNQLKESINYKL